MDKSDEPKKRAKVLFNKVSSLQQFVTEHEQQFKTLTKREAEVLTLVASGMNNQTVALKLGISRATVQNHRSGIRQKLAIDSQADYIKYALAFGLIAF